MVVLVVVVVVVVFVVVVVVVVVVVIVLMTIMMTMIIAHFCPGVRQSAAAVHVCSKRRPAVTHFHNPTQQYTNTVSHLHKKPPPTLCSPPSATSAF